MPPSARPLARRESQGWARCLTFAPTSRPPGSDRTCRRGGLPAAATARSATGLWIPLAWSCGRSLAQRPFVTSVARCGPPVAAARMLWFVTVGVRPHPRPLAQERGRAHRARVCVRARTCTSVRACVSAFVRATACLRARGCMCVCMRAMLRSAGRDHACAGLRDLLAACPSSALSAAQ